MHKKSFQLLCNNNIFRHSLTKVGSAQFAQMTIRPLRQFAQPSVRPMNTFHGGPTTLVLCIFSRNDTNRNIIERQNRAFLHIFDQQLSLNFEYLYKISACISNKNEKVWNHYGFKYPIYWMYHVFRLQITTRRRNNSPMTHFNEHVQKCIWGNKK